MFFRKCQRPGCRNSCNNVRSSVKNFCTPACATAHQMSTSTVVVVQVILFEIDCAIFYTNLHELFVSS